MDTLFTLLAFEPSSHWPRFKPVVSNDPHAVLDAAAAMLEENSACDRVEIWYGSRRINMLNRGLQQTCGYASEPTDRRPPNPRRERRSWQDEAG